MLRMRVSLTLCECREGKCKNQKITLQGKPAGALLSRVRCVTHDLADISVSHIPPLVTNHQRDAFLHMSSCVLHGCDRRPSHGPLPGLSSEGTGSGDRQGWHGQAAGTCRGSVDRQWGSRAGSGAVRRRQRAQAEGTGRGQAEEQAVGQAEAQAPHTQPRSGPRQMGRAGTGISHSSSPPHPFPGHSWLFKRKAINPLVQRQMNLIPWGIPSFRTGLKYFSNLPPFNPNLFWVFFREKLFGRVRQNAWQYGQLGSF